MDLTYVRLTYSSVILIAVEALLLIFELCIHAGGTGFTSENSPHSHNRVWAGQVGGTQEPDGVREEMRVNGRAGNERGSMGWLPNFRHSPFCPVPARR